MDFTNDSQKNPEIPSASEVEVSGITPVSKKAHPLVWVEVNAVEDDEPILIQYDQPSFKAAITDGTIKKDQEARLIGTEPWSKVEDVAGQVFGLNLLYRPVGAYFSKGLLYGAIGGFLLKAVDTIYTLAIVDESLGAPIVFALLIASFFLANQVQILPVAAFAFAGYQYGFFLFGALITTGLVGGIFGAAAGALIGTIAGYISKSSLPAAPDRTSEGTSVFWWGIVAPIVFLSIAIPGYLFWLNPMILEWASSR